MYYLFDVDIFFSDMRSRPRFSLKTKKRKINESIDNFFFLSFQKQMISVHFLLITIWLLLQQSVILNVQTLVQVKHHNDHVDKHKLLHQEQLRRYNNNRYLHNNMSIIIIQIIINRKINFVLYYFRITTGLSSVIPTVPLRKVHSFFPFVVLIYLFR